MQKKMTRGMGALLLALGLMSNGGCARELVQAGACVAGDSTKSATSSAARGQSIGAGDKAGVAVGVALMAAGAAMDRRRSQPPPQRWRDNRGEAGCSAVTSAD